MEPEQTKDLEIRQEMMSAVKARDVARVRTLLDQEPNLANTRTAEGDSPLLLSIYFGAKEITELLLARGAEPNLFEAVALGQTERVRERVTADPRLLHAYSHDGWTALHLAAFFGQSGTVAYLLQAGADVRAIARNGNGNTPLHAALATRQDEIARQLLATGSDVNTPDAAGWTPLHHASYNGSLEMVTLLLERGARVEARGGQGQKSPREMALEKEHTAVATLLQQHGG